MCSICKSPSLLFWVKQVCSYLNKNEFEDEYVYWIARGIQDVVQKLGYGGAQPNVSNKQLEALEFPFPPKQIQLKIILFLNALRDGTYDGIYFNASIEKKILRLHKTSLDLLTFKISQNQQLSLLTALRQAILTEAVQGGLTAQWRRDNPGQEPATELLRRIAAEKARLIREKKISKEKPLPPIREEEMPYALPEGWGWCRLGEVGYTQTGSTPPKSQNEYFGNYIPFLGPSDISPNTMKYPEIGLSKLGLEKSRLIPTGSLMMVCIGGSIGKCNIVEMDVTCNQQINTLTPIAIPSDMVKIIAQSPYFQASVKEKATGSATPIINKGKWEVIPIPLPPLKEQHAIVQKVNTLLAYCDELEQQVRQSKADVERLMQAVLGEVFGAGQSGSVPV